MRVLLKMLYWLALAGLLCAAAIGAAFVRRSHQMDTMIVQAASRQQIDPRLAAALVWRSSQLNTSLSTNGHYGLLALTPEDGKAWSKASGAPFETFDLFDPRRNLQIGLWKLSMASLAWADKPNGHIWALAEWQAGRAAASAWASAAVDDDPLAAIGDPAVRSFVGDVVRRAQRDEVTLGFPRACP